jgi:hypothetical protein
VSVTLSLSVAFGLSLYDSVSPICLLSLYFILSAMSSPSSFASLPFLTRSILQYEQFLYLHAKYPGYGLPASALVDLMWHAHMLFPRE